MPKSIRHFYDFGPFRLDRDRHRLLRDGNPVHLSPKALEALIVLVENAGTLLERDELMQAVWSNTFVEDANLTVAISNLRKVLGQHADSAEYIETIPRVGYRFVAEVHERYEEAKPLVIEKHSQSRTVIEEELLPDQLPDQAIVRSTAISAKAPLLISSRRLVAAVSILLLLGAGSLFYFWRNHDKPAAPHSLAAAGIRSIAILPPKALNGEYDPALSLGIADALITRLGELQKLTVRPTNAISRYVDGNQDPVAAGQALGVDAVLDGTVQKSNGRVRVRLRLIKVADGVQLWSGDFDEGDADIFKLQDSISRRFADALYSDLTNVERSVLSRRQTTNPQAYAFYLQGNYYWSKRTGESVRSMEYLRKAIELDPNFAQAYATLAAVDASITIPSPEAELLISKALQLDNNMAEAHATYAFIRMFHHWDWNTAEKELDRALELNPNSAVAHHWKGVYLSLRGRLDEAKTELQRALELDPVSLIIMADLGQLHYFAHEYDQAINYCNRALALDPDFLVAHQYLLDIYHAKGMNDAVFNELLYLQHRYSTTEVKQQFRDTFTRGGVRAVTEQEINLRSNEKGVGLLMARLYSRIGDKERALYWLDRAVSEERLFWTAYINVDPLFDPLHADGRFKAIVSRMGLS